MPPSTSTPDPFPHLQGRHLVPRQGRCDLLRHVRVSPGLGPDPDGVRLLLRLRRRLLTRPRQQAERHQTLSVRHTDVIANGIDSLAGVQPNGRTNTRPDLNPDPEPDQVTNPGPDPKPVGDSDHRANAALAVRSLSRHRSL